MVLICVKMKATEDLLSMLIPISLMCLGAPNMYDIVDLGCISDGQCYAMVINESGQVAGYGDAPNGMSTHGFVWDGSNHASGIYFAKLTANNVSSTAKLMLVK